MRAHGSRTKKLIVAFHFQRTRRAAWKCETCRKSGLEEKRRCGWIEPPDEPERVVWTRGQVVLTACPVSFISSESWALLEEFYAWKLLGGSGWRQLPARTVDAFFLLEKELAKEKGYAEQ